MPVPRQPFRSFTVDPVVTVQLVRDDGACWESTFSPAENRANTGTRDEARFP